MLHTKNPPNGIRPVTACLPRQAGPVSHLPVAADAELLSPNHSSSTGDISWDFLLTELVRVKLGKPDSAYNLLKILLIFLGSGKKLGRGGLEGKRNPTIIQKEQFKAH